MAAPRPAPKIVVLCGPTASGKSQAALRLAERVGAEIVSCDSMAVFRFLDLGTAKPSLEDRARVPHHLVDVVDPNESFTAALYVEQADRTLAGIAARGRVAVLVGGSGLYLRALLDGLFESPPPDLALRAELKAEAAVAGWPALHARLAVVDPRTASRIAPNDRVRIERALEVYRQTGVPLSELQAAVAREPRYRPLVMVTDPPAAALEERIARRAAAMVAAGLVEETRRVVARFGRDLKPLGGLGYKEALACLEGRLAAGDLVETIRLATRRFAKRQRTWFARQPGIRVGDAGVLPDDAIEGYLGRPR